MSNGNAERLGPLGLLCCVQSAFPSTGSPEGSSGALGGFMLVVGFVIVAYALVFLVKLLAGSDDLGPDKMNATEFDDFTRASDDPSWRVPDSWPRRK